MNQTEFKNIDPPFWVAWNQALASIRVRFFRQLVTSVGIALGIAFLAFMLGTQMAQPKGATDRDQSLWLIGTSLIMCLVGVTNSMLMSVSERYREIGTIKCLGASDGFIVKVFFLEAALLGVAGSGIGSAVGLLLAAATTPGFTAPLALLLFGMGTGAGTLMTIFAAIAPAVQASRMPAAAALRVDV